MIVQSLNFFQNGITYVNELNKALTEIAIVTGQTQREVTELGKEYNKLAYQMGVTTNEIAKASVEFYRQGLTQEETMNRVSTATQYAKISALDFTKAAEILTATVNSMNVDIERASDVFSFLGDATATGADEIGVAFQRVGGSAGALNLEFEKVASWIAVLSSRTREGAATIGNSIKSILARIQNLTETGFDETDGTSINRVAKALATVDIALVDSTGQFRNFGLVMDELGKKWSSLDSRTKSYLSTTIAGTYQQSRFLNLMEGYADTIPLYEQALQSAGTTQQKFNTYLESNEAALNRLKATLEGLWQSSFNSEAIKIVINSLDLFLKITKSVVDSIGIFPALLGATAFGFLSLNKATRDSIIQQGILSSSLVKTGDSMRIATGASRAYQISLYNLTLAARGASIALSTVGTVAKNALLFLGRTIIPIAAFTALGYAISKATEKLIESHEKQKQIRQEIENQTKSYSDNKDQIHQLVNEYQRLSQQVEQGKISETDKEYLETQQKLYDLLPMVAEKVDEKGQAHLRSADAIKKELDNLEQLSTLESKKFLEDFSDNVDTIKDKISKLTEENRKLNSEWAMTASGNSMYFKGVSTEDQIEALINQREINAAIDEATRLYSQYAVEYANTLGVRKQLTDADEEYISQLIEQNKSLLLTKGGQEELTKQIKDYVGTVGDARKVIGDAFSGEEIKNFSQEQKGVIESISNAMEKGYTDWEQFRSVLNDTFGQTQASNIINNLNNEIKENADLASLSVEIYDEYGEQVDYVTGTMEDLEKALDNVKDDYQAITKIINELIEAKQLDKATSVLQNEAYEALSNELSPINDLLEKLAEGKQISAAEAYELIQAEEGLADAISIENGQIKVNEQAVVELRNAKIKSYKDIQESTKQELLSQITATANKLNLFSQEIKGLKNLEEAHRLVADTVEKLNQKLHNARSIQEAMYYEQQINEVKGYSDELDRLAEMSEISNAALTQVGTSTERMSDSTSKSVYVTDRYKLKLEELNTQIAKMQSLQEKFPKHSKEYQDALKKEIDLLEEKKKLMESEASSLASQIRSGNIKQTGKITSNSYSSSSYASGGSNADIIWNFLKSKGFSDSIVAGIMGNLKLESGLNPNALNKSSGAYGIAQWLGVRKTALHNYARSTGSSANNLTTQLNFLWKELNSTEKRTMNYLKSNQNASAATIAAAFDRLFERSEGTHVPQRQRYANQFYSQYSGSSSSYKSSSYYGSNADKAQAIDQAKNEVNQLQQDIISVENQIQQLVLSLVESKMASFERSKQAYEDEIAKVEFLANQYENTSSEWRKYKNEQFKYLTKQKEIHEKEIKFIENELKTNRELNEQQRDYLNNILQQKVIELYSIQSDIIGIREEIKESYNAIADEIIEIYKESYEKQKEIALKANEEELKSLERTHDEKMRILDEELKAYEEIINMKLKQIDQQQDEESFQKELVKKKKERAEIQKQIDLLSMDDSLEARKRVSELREQLNEKDVEIDEFLNNRKIELEKKNLQESLEAKREQIEEDKLAEESSYQDSKDRLDRQKENINTYWENLINDERAWAKMRENILNDNVSAMQNQLSKFITIMKNNMSTLGQSITQNLIDKINDAKKNLSGINGSFNSLVKGVSTPTTTHSDVKLSSSNSTSTKSSTTANNDDQWKTTTALNLRSSPSYGNNIKLVMPKGAKIEFLGMEKGWAKVRYNGQTGYAGKSYLQKFDTGGYTGNDEGLAYLHEKELILNKFDTKNILKTVELVRSFANPLTKIPIIKNIQPTPTTPPPNVNLNINIERVEGGQKGADDLFKIIGDRLKGKGVIFNP